VPVTYVGHPLADELPLEPNKKAARKALKIKQNKKVIAMLPGSRQSEVHQHADLFVQTAKIISQENADTEFLVPLITRETRKIFEQALYRNETNGADIKLLFGHAHDAIEAADIVLVASGTATLEAALLKRPMVITYRMPTLSWWILKRMNNLPYVGLPNVLAGKFIVPELLQKQATPQKIADEISKLLIDKDNVKAIKEEFIKMHIALKQDSAKKAADVVLSYL